MKSPERFWLGYGCGAIMAGIVDVLDVHTGIVPTGFGHLIGGSILVTLWLGVYWIGRGHWLE